MFNPVQPGESMRRNMTAEWFNQTLPKARAAQLNQQPPHSLPPGTLECVLDGGTPSRFDPVALDSIVTNTNVDYTPRVSVSGLTEDNWGVMQAGSTGTIDVCFWGLCLATVTDVSGGLVTYSTTNSRLETSESGKGQILWYNATGPSLISIGTPGGSGGGGGETGDTLFRFTLTSGWTSGVADATIKDIDAGTTIESASVYDSLGVFSDGSAGSLISGDSGYCEKQNNKYYIYNAPCGSAT